MIYSFIRVAPVIHVFFSLSLPPLPPVINLSMFVFVIRKNMNKMEARFKISSLHLSSPPGNNLKKYK